MRTLLAIALLSAPSAMAQDLDGFEPGKVLPEFGWVAPVETSFAPPDDQPFKVVFDVARTAEAGENRHISKVARFINMHGEGGLDPRPLSLVVVIHGAAVGDLTAEDRNQQRGLVEALIDADVRFVVCGQSLTALGVDPEVLLPGVEVALSAMTAHASLQAEGYSLNPF